MMKNISFTKMSGAGNDFVVFDRDENKDLNLSPEAIRKLCDRRFGIGADGVITVSNSEGYDFEMEYYNADGSTGTLCGNGARCAIKFADVSGRIKKGSTKFVVNNVEYTGAVLSSGLIRFDLNEPKEIKLDFKIKAGDQLINSSFTNTGSPHAVILIGDVLRQPAKNNSEYTNIEEFPVLPLGKEIRYHKDFAPAGTNVNFINIAHEKLYIRTYERGVEDETLACGTGSVASAVIAYKKGLLKPPVTLVTRGGDQLIVDFHEENSLFKNLSLTGPAVITFAGRIEKSLYF